MLNTIYTDSILERYEDLDTVKGIMAELDDGWFWFFVWMIFIPRLPVW